MDNIITLKCKDLDCKKKLELIKIKVLLNLTDYQMNNKCNYYY